MLLFTSFECLAGASDEDEATAFATFIHSVIRTTQGLSSGAICIYGNDEVSKSIMVRERNVISLDNDPKKYTSCKVIYIARGREKGLRVEIDKFNKKKILTIGVFDGFSDTGGMVQVQMGRRTFELTLNSKALKDSGIRLSPLALDLVIN